MLPQTLRNNVSPEVVIRERHTMALSPCCPVSKNPRPGSFVAISYPNKGNVLDVGPLYAYIHQFVGGLHDEQGELIVRDMEGMIARIAQDCAQVLGVPVRVIAQLVIAPKQEMMVKATAHPKKEEVA
jgi:hypothetical protein